MFYYCILRPGQKANQTVIIWNWKKKQNDISKCHSINPRQACIWILWAYFALLLHTIPNLLWKTYRYVAWVNNSRNIFLKKCANNHQPEKDNCGVIRAPQNDKLYRNGGYLFESKNKRLSDIAKSKLRTRRCFFIKCVLNQETPCHRILWILKIYVGSRQD